jgi:hypothetical protein
MEPVWNSVCGATTYVIYSDAFMDSWVLFEGMEHRLLNVFASLKNFLAGGKKTNPEMTDMYATKTALDF